MGLRHGFLVLVVQTLGLVKHEHECQHLAKLDGDCVGSSIAQTNFNESYWRGFRICQIDSPFSFAQILCVAILSHLSRREIRMSNEQKSPTHLFATIGALTQRGGRVTKASSKLTVVGLAVARVGDIVTYEDGSEAVITDGAGRYAIGGDKPLALVGSRLSNGDHIVETPQRSWGIHVPAGTTADGLFDPTYVSPPAPLRYRLAVRGATTARGGVLRETTGTWDTGIRLGKAGIVGDLIHYADGSTARIISGLGLSDNRNFEPLAFVGSELDNGDTITDSPEREGLISADTFTVVKLSAATR
ncbi:PAAR domain-containing protein [Burkholderia stagnalis]|uniref:PAAR domain-containing protein n=1 Tax=Burkholderia stagnalis TaxID=1503054 RepID=UPI001E658E28|nr:PAAR domain-containing protein [Burkholderia stagnalis]